MPAPKTLLAASGFRLVASLTLDEAAARLADQGSLGLAWLELGEEDATPVLDQLLAQLNDLAACRRTAVVVCAPIELVDMVAARLTGSRTEILVDPDDAQRAATLATGGRRRPRRPARPATSARTMPRACASCRTKWDGSPRRLPGCRPAPGSPAVKPAEGKARAPDVDVETVRAVIRARRLRSRFFSEELFADPAWDMLLDLLQAEIAQLRVPVSSLVHRRRRCRRRPR